jgi:hypothetical protein
LPRWIRHVIENRKQLGTHINIPAVSSVSVACCGAGRRGLYQLIDKEFYPNSGKNFILTLTLP